MPPFVGYTQDSKWPISLEFSFSPLPNLQGFLQEDTLGVAFERDSLASLPKSWLHSGFLGCSDTGFSSAFLSSAAAQVDRSDHPLPDRASHQLLVFSNFHSFLT